MQSTIMAIASLCLPGRHASRARIHRLRELINLTDAGVVACALLSVTLTRRPCSGPANCMYKVCCEVHARYCTECRVFTTVVL
ncbi:hypothetical protein V8C42DRAFT_310702 [Trichoderma barbatum]